MQNVPATSLLLPGRAKPYLGLAGFLPSLSPTRRPMETRMKKILILAALAVAPLAQPALAESAAAPAPPMNRAVVAHSDLDLRTQSGARALDRRIWRAVVEVCGTTSEFDLKGKNAIRECRRDTRAAASAEADLAIADATRRQPIQVSAVGK